jgi:hypothetical protein
MAFTQSTFLPLSAQANSSAPRYFVYKSDDLIATIKAADYFLGIFQTLTVDDVIVVVADADGNKSMFELIVTATSSSTVTVQLKLSQELTATAAVTAGVNSVELNHATVVVAATIADSKAHQGLFVVKDTSASGTAAHTLTLTAGTFNGTNNVATLNAPLECLVVWFDSAGAGTVVVNVGTVALS